MIQTGVFPGIDSELIFKAAEGTAPVGPDVRQQVFGNFQKLWDSTMSCGLVDYCH